MMKILILDDQQYRHDHFERRFKAEATEIVHVYDPDEAAVALGKTTFDLALLDHRLEYYVSEPFPTEVTGLATAQLIASMPIEMRPRRVIVHSLDLSGAHEMAKVLRSAGVPVAVEPFTFA